MASGVGCSQQARLDRRVDRANQFFEKEQYAEAVIEYLNVLRMDRSNQVAIVRSGLAHFELGDAVKAMQFLMVAKEMDPGNIDVRLKVATIFRLGNYIKEAREEALELLKRDPGNLEGLLLLAETASEPDEVMDAYRLLKERESEFSDQARYHLALALTHLKLRDFEAAEKAYALARELEPTSVAVLESSASFYALKGDSDQAGALYAEAANQAPVASAARVRWAAFKYSIGEREEAKQILQEAVAEAPEFLLAWGRLADYAFVEGRVEDCEELVETILSKNPNDFGGRQLRARLLFANGEFDEAANAFRVLCEQFPHSAALHQQLGLAELKNRNIPKAIGELREAVKLDPNLIQAQLQLAELSIRSGDASSVLENLVALAEQYPDNPQVLILLGSGYQSEGDIAQAVETFVLLSERQKDSHLGPFLLSGALFQAEKHTEALVALDEALRRTPNLLPALMRRVQYDLKEGRTEEAIARVRTVIEAYPKQPGLRHLLGSVYFSAGDLKEAESAFRQEIELEPRQLNSYLALANLLVRGDRLDEALQELNDALAVDENNLKALMLSGILYERQSAYEKALIHYEKILSLVPDFAIAANNAAYIYSTKLGKIDKAFELAKHARELAPNDRAIADTLGWIAYQRGEYPWALTLITEAAETYADNPDVQYHLGMAYAALGRDALAVVALNKAISVEKPLSNAREVERLLSILRRPLEDLGEEDQPAIEAVLADDPKNTAALIRQGVLLEKSGKLSKAQGTYDTVLKRNPHYFPAAVRLARYFDKHKNDVKKAAEFAVQARELAPSNPEIADLAGWLTFRRGDYDWAHTLLKEAARDLPQDPSAQYHLGRSMYVQGKAPEAELQTSKALEISENFFEAPEARSFLELVRAQQMDVLSRAVHDKALSVLQSHPDSFAAQMVVAMMYTQEKAYSEAVKIYEGLMERQPRFAFAAKNLAVLYEGPLDDAAKAYTWAAKAREVLAEDVDLSFLLGKIHYRQGEFEWAASLLDECAKQRPKDPEILYFLGVCRAQQGDTSRARKALQQALVLNPSFAYASEAKRVLSELEMNP